MRSVAHPVRELEGGNVCAPHPRADGSHRSDTERVPARQEDVRRDLEGGHEPANRDRGTPGRIEAARNVQPVVKDCQLDLEHRERSSRETVNLDSKW